MHNNSLEEARLLIKQYFLDNYTKSKKSRTHKNKLYSIHKRTRTRNRK